MKWNNAYKTIYILFFLSLYIYIFGAQRIRERQVAAAVAECEKTTKNKPLKLRTGEKR